MLLKQEKTYIVKRVKNDFKWEDIDRADVNIFCWEYDYKPEVYGQAVLTEDGSLIAKLTCFEKNPKAVMKNFMDSVCKDSCLEFFVALDNKNPDVYINFEGNSTGAALICIGKTKGRKRIDEVLGHIPYFKPEILEDRWTIEYRLTKEEIAVLFPGVELKEGYEFTANFFKCGDDTESKHFGMWNHSIAVLPQFHRPEYFGKLIIG